MVYKVTEIAEKLNLNVQVVRNKLEKGEIKGKNENRRWLVREENLLEYTKGLRDPIPVKEFAKEVKMCTKSIRDKVISGELVGAKIGGKWYIDRLEINKFI